MDHKINTEITLTTSSPGAHYGHPVLRFETIRYPDCGPADGLLWMGDHYLGDHYTCADLVYEWGSKEERTSREYATAKLFLSQWPSGPQLR